MRSIDISFPMLALLTSGCYCRVKKVLYYNSIYKSFYDLFAKDSFRPIGMGRKEKSFLCWWFGKEEENYWNLICWRGFFYDSMCRMMGKKVLKGLKILIWKLFRVGWLGSNQQFCCSRKIWKIILAIFSGTTYPKSPHPNFNTWKIIQILHPQNFLSIIYSFHLLPTSFPLYSLSIKCLINSALDWVYSSDIDHFLLCLRRILITTKIFPRYLL